MDLASGKSTGKSIDLSVYHEVWMWCVNSIQFQYQLCLPDSSLDVYPSWYVDDGHWWLTDFYVRFYGSPGWIWSRELRNESNACRPWIHPVRVASGFIEHEFNSHDGSMVLVYMLTWLGYIDGIHGAPYIAAPWIRHGIYKNKRIVLSPSSVRSTAWNQSKIACGKHNILG